MKKRGLTFRWCAAASTGVCAWWTCCSAAPCLPCVCESALPRRPSTSPSFTSERRCWLLSRRGGGGVGPSFGCGALLPFLSLLLLSMQRGAVSLLLVCCQNNK